MGIKEKELEDLILNLMDKSSAIQRKMRDICGVSQEGAFKSEPRENVPADGKPSFFDKKKTAVLEATIEQLKTQVNQYKNDYQQVSATAQKYKESAVLFQSKCTRLENEKQHLEAELESIKTESEDCKKHISRLKQENADLKESERSLSASLTETADNLQIMKERFSVPVALLAKYRSLPSSVRNGLSNIICDKNEVLFIASCSTPEHLKAVWTYTKKLTGSTGNGTEIEILKDIFDYFFEIFNDSLSEPMYIRDSVETGMLFDDDEYDRYAGSATSGNITQVVLRGYKSINTGNIICRSLVRV